MLLACFVRVSQGSVLCTATTIVPIVPSPLAFAFALPRRDWATCLISTASIDHAFRIDYLQIRSFWQLAASCSNELRCQIASMVEAKPANDGPVTKRQNPLTPFILKRGLTLVAERVRIDRFVESCIPGLNRPKAPGMRGRLNHVAVSHLTK